MRTKIAPLAEKYGVSMVVLFGSQATGKTHKGSDVDFAITADTRLSPLEIARVAFDFSQALKLKEVDVALLTGAPALLLQQVAQKGILVYEREPGLFAQFRMYAIKQFIEAKPLFALRHASLQKFLYSQV